MAHRLVLLAHGLVGLEVAQAVGVVAGEAEGVLLLAKTLGDEVEGLLSAFVDEVGGKVQVFLFSGEIVKLHQGELDFLVAWIGVQLALVRPDDLHEVVHVAQHHVEKGALTRGAGIGDGRLQQMAGAVKLVAIAEVLEAVFPVP